MVKERSMYSEYDFDESKSTFRTHTSGIACSDHRSRTRDKRKREIYHHEYLFVFFYLPVTYNSNLSLSLCPCSFIFFISQDPSPFPLKHVTHVLKVILGSHKYLMRELCWRKLLGGVGMIHDEGGVGWRADDDVHIILATVVFCMAPKT